MHFQSSQLTHFFLDIAESTAVGTDALCLAQFPLDFLHTRQNILQLPGLFLLFRHPGFSCYPSADLLLHLYIISYTLNAGLPISRN
jgi:hypothetical protein